VLLYGRINICGPLADANYRRQHPWEFALDENPLANALAKRFESYLAGKEPLVVVGYFVLTALEHSLKGRPGVAKTLEVSSKVLERFSLLVSSVGTLRTARKVSESLETRDLTEAESFWLERVIVELIARFGAVAAGRRPIRQLTNADLPPSV